MKFFVSEWVESVGGIQRALAIAEAVTANHRRLLRLSEIDRLKEENAFLRGVYRAADQELKNATAEIDYLRRATPRPDR